MTLPIVERVDGSYRVPVGGEKAIVPNEWTEQPIDSVYAPWEDAVKALFRAAAEVTAEGNTIHVQIESPEHALVGHGVADDEADATARLAVLDHEDIVAFNGSDVWTVPGPDADRDIRAFGYATVTDLAADTLRSALDSIEVQAEEFVESGGEDAELQLYEVIEEIDVLAETLDHYHKEIRRSIALNRRDDTTIDPIDGLTVMLVSTFRLDRSVEGGALDGVVESCGHIAAELGNVARRTQPLSDIDHEAFISELNALADVSAEPLDTAANDGSPAEAPETTDGSSDEDGNE